MLYTTARNQADVGMHGRHAKVQVALPNRRWNKAGYLELTGSAEPHVILPRQLLHAIAGLVDCDATHVTADQLVLVIVHITVTNRTPVSRPPYLQTSMQCDTRTSTRTAQQQLMQVKRTRFMLKAVSATQDAQILPTPHQYKQSDLQTIPTAHNCAHVMLHHLTCSVRNSCESCVIRPGGSTLLTLTGLCLLFSMSCQGAYTAASSFSVALRAGMWGRAGVAPGRAEGFTSMPCWSSQRPTCMGALPATSHALKSTC